MCTHDCMRIGYYMCSMITRSEYVWYSCMYIRFDANVHDLMKYVRTLLVFMYGNRQHCFIRMQNSKHGLHVCEHDIDDNVHDLMKYVRTLLVFVYVNDLMI